ncbi:hypothetical protein [Bacillus sp. ISL-39]|uniref:hypothetical protein n=1 Tax=Bacillus sp. ISL-39 TaxID=2819124 RepID=UPI001BE95D6C|nr:hypothetical protein [Bacillus sp. ISL-39]MBT2640056.1 hypothetical protein [Bacillus sp. ISL-39]
MGMKFTSTNSKIAKDIISDMKKIPLDLSLRYPPNINPINPPIIPSVKAIGIRNSMSGNIGEIDSTNSLNIREGIKCNRSTAKCSACLLNKNTNNKFSNEDKKRKTKNPMKKLFLYFNKLTPPKTSTNKCNFTLKT